MNLSLNSSDFPSNFKAWREYRKLSQLELALNAEISQKHISWLENGKSNPSREIIIRLADALAIPLRERNELLNSAGYASIYPCSDLSEPQMQPVREAISAVMQNNFAYPSIALDRYWNIVEKNTIASTLLEFALPNCLDLVNKDGKLNLAYLTLHPKGLRNIISNWDQVARSFVNRIIREASVSNSKELTAHINRIIEISELNVTKIEKTNNLYPIIPIELNIFGHQIAIFSVISTFGTPFDITADELRLESFYPSNEETKIFFNNFADRHQAQSIKESA